MSKKADWEARYEKIKEQYPVVGADWSRLGFESDIFVDIMGDVIKAEGKRSRPGKRPALDRQAAETELARLSGDGYSEYEFDKAFRILTNGRSIRGIANKVGLDKSYVHRLLRGDTRPSLEAMEKIAVAYRKDPSYFLEYRISMVLMMIEGFLKDSPETATSWYLGLKRRVQRV